MNMSIEILEPRTIEVTEKFINHANFMAESKGWHRHNADALLLEYTLIKEKKVQRELNWRHDFIYRGMKIDAKEIQGEYFNIQPGKTEQYKESIIGGDLTHFLFYQTDRPREGNPLLKAGDRVRITPIALCDARKTIRLNIQSNKEGSEAYVPVETMLMIGETYHETIPSYS